MSHNVADGLARVRERMEAAFARRSADVDSSRQPTLVAVSKRHPIDRIREAYAAGHRSFGENRAQEFRDKHRELPDLDIDWHFIGQLQRNKVKYVVGKALIHTVDRADLAAAISDRAGRLEGPDPVEVLIEVNSGEAQKGGVLPAELPALLDAVSQSEHLRCVGLMTMAPIGAPESARPHFRALRELRDTQMLTRRPKVALDTLSMGMSADFEVAIEEGATLVRVGSAIFGPRQG